eukprot:CAMPEP_0119270414 /NCGR_PEP_ID=MMETSP1329-20130426/7427_1 /TAXON_ID=114041 /ORGANISM="Genus nov. species nov., Strain RCC1024" /LENGTH=517 /DNA_ID=CAMNT_0007270435 /DNA_START=113 /DNA_END=1663 /DNA_ORIENTATION=-
MLRRLIIALAAVSAAASTDAVELERRAQIVNASRDTIAHIRHHLCGKVSETHAPLLVASVGDHLADVAPKLAARDYARLVEKLARGQHRVAPQTFLRDAFAYAGETSSFDFRKIDAYDAVAGPIVIAYWQELVAAYPRAKVVLVLGPPHKRPSRAATRARLERCANLTAGEAGENIAAYGSPCPSRLQQAKVEDQVAAEIMENGPLLEVWDARTLEPVAARDWRAFEPDEFFPTVSNNTLAICPGFGATATRALAEALKQVGLHAQRPVEHFDTQLLKAVVTAAEDDAFDWVDTFGGFAAVSDTPVPAYWLEAAHAFPRAKLILTVREEYSREYASRIDTGRRRLTGYYERHFCDMEEKCAAACETRGKSHAGRRAIQEAGAAQCEALSFEATEPDVLARCQVARLLGRPAGPECASEKANGVRFVSLRLPVYKSPCPSRIQTSKAYRNAMRHVVRRTSHGRLLVLDIVDAPHDGYGRLCPFIGSTDGVCARPEGTMFPHSGHKNHVQGRRRLVNCL